VPADYEPKVFAKKEFEIPHQPKQDLYTKCLTLHEVSEMDGMIKYAGDNFKFEDEV